MLSECPFVFGTGNDYNMISLFQSSNSSTCKYRKFAVLGESQSDFEAVKEALKSHPTDWITVLRLVRENRDLLFYRQRYRKYTILHSAVAEGKAEYVALLLYWGSDPNVRDAFGFTPLATAASLDVEHADVVSVLLRHSHVDAFPRCDSRGTPLHGAALRGHSKVCALLLTRLNDANNGMLGLKDWRGCNALEVAKEHGNKEAHAVLAAVFRLYEPFALVAYTNENNSDALPPRTAMSFRSAAHMALQNGE